jgi:hypothetical protein
MTNFVYSSLDAIAFDPHGPMYRGICSFLSQFVDLLDIRH